MGNGRPSLLHFPGLGHFLIVLIVTGIEITGLVGWLAVARGGTLASAFTNLPVLASLPQLDLYLQSLTRTRFASGFLGIFLLIEHIIAQMDQTGRLVSRRQIIEIVGFTSLEVVIWTVWLLLIPINGIVALLFFLGLLFVEHQITDNVKKGLHFLHFASSRSVVFRGLIIFTLFEVVGAVVWVAQGLVVILAIGSTTEHYIARNVGQLSETVERKAH